MEIIKEIITSLLFYVIPFATGMAILPKKQKEQLGATLPVAAFGLGIVVLYALFLLGIPMTTALFSSIPRALVFQWMSILVASFTGIFAIPSTITYIKAYGKSLVFPVVLSLFLSAIAFSIWKYDSPYPLVLNWDILEHQTLVSTISQGSIGVITSRLSDTFTFNGYTTLYHVILSIPYSILKPNPAGFWYVIEYVHTTLSILACYVIAKRLTGRKETGIVAAIFGAFIFESYVATSSLFLVPQSFSAMLGAFLFAGLVTDWDDKKTPWMWLFSLIPGILLTHYIVGTVAVFVGVATVLTKHVTYLRYRLVASLATVSFPLVLVSASILLSQNVNLATINGGEAAAFIYTPAKSFEFLRIFAGYFPAILFPIGIVLFLFKKDRRFATVAIAAVSLATVLFLPIPYTFKFLSFGRYILLLPMAFVVGELMRKIHFFPIRLMAYTSLGILCAALLILNARYWKDSISHRGISTLVSQDELTASSFLAHNYQGKPDTLLISDPATQYILEAFSGINSPGGAYMSNENRVKLASLEGATSPDAWKDTLRSINDSIGPTERQTTLFVASSRYYSWIKAGTEKQLDKSFNIWEPSALTFDEKSDINAEIIKSYSIEKVYENPSLVIFEINK